MRFGFLDTLKIYNIFNYFNFFKIPFVFIGRGSINVIVQKHFMFMHSKSKLCGKLHGLHKYGIKWPSLESFIKDNTSFVALRCLFLQKKSLTSTCIMFIYCFNHLVIDLQTFEKLYYEQLLTHLNLIDSRWNFRPFVREICLLTFFVHVK